MATLLNVAPRPGSRDLGRQFADPWLTFVVNYVGEVNTLTLAAFAAINEMQESGVQISEELAKWVCDAYAAQAALPLKSSMSRLAANAHVNHKAKSKVYFLRMGNRIKIGVSVDPPRRVRDLSLPASALMFAVDGGYELEHWMHHQLEEHRIDGSEWFEMVDKVLGLIEEVRLGRRP